MHSNLVYVSARKEICTKEEIDKILAACQRNNKDLDITGVLLYTDSRFVQYLEGDYDQIMGLYEKIKSDPRHSSVVLISVSTINERLFPSWQMGAKPLNGSGVAFDTLLGKEEAEQFEAILDGKSGKTHRAVDLIKKFF